MLAILFIYICIYLQQRGFYFILRHIKYHQFSFNSSPGAQWFVSSPFSSLYLFQSNTKEDYFFSSGEHGQDFSNFFVSPHQ